MERACFSDGETEQGRRARGHLAQTQVLSQVSARARGAEGLRAREGACRPALLGPRLSHLRYRSEQAHLEAIAAVPPPPRLWRRGVWVGVPTLCTSVFHQGSCSRPGSSPEIPFPSQAKPPSHQPPSPLGPEHVGRMCQGDRPEIQTGMSLYLPELQL